MTLRKKKYILWVSPYNAESCGEEGLVGWHRSFLLYVRILLCFHIMSESYVD